MRRQAHAVDAGEAFFEQGRRNAAATKGSIGAETDQVPMWRRGPEAGKLRAMAQPIDEPPKSHGFKLGRTMAERLPGGLAKARLLPHGRGEQLTIMAPPRIQRPAGIKDSAGLGCQMRPQPAMARVAVHEEPQLRVVGESASQQRGDTGDIASACRAKNRKKRRSDIHDAVLFPRAGAYLRHIRQRRS